VSVADEIFNATHQAIAARRNIPQSTYRLQFHAGFTFQNATAIVPYLAKLGISHVYASPYFKARPGSLHGYDIIDHAQLNPEVGTTDDFEAFVQTLAGHGMSHIVDMVPNHAGVATNSNPWWNDVLENGMQSRYAHHFDINWHSPLRRELHGKVLLPVLGESYADVLKSGQLTLTRDENGFCIKYYDRRFPLAIESYRAILEMLEHAVLPAGFQPVLNELTSLQTGESGSVQTDIPSGSARRQAVKTRFLEFIAAHSTVRDAIDHLLARFTGAKGDHASWAALDRLLDQQHYRLEYWALASTQINYRRFFDINDLAALRMEDDRVFDDTHRLALSLLTDEKINGLRIDHPDGLYDPEKYFRRLQSEYFLAIAQHHFKKDHADSPSDWLMVRAELLARFDSHYFTKTSARSQWPCYVVAEKILAFNEPLPKRWAVDGTSGYDFLDMVNGLFVDSASEKAFTDFYKTRWSEEENFDDLAHAKKLLILDSAFPGETQSLATQLDQLAPRDPRDSQFTLSQKLLALRELIACFPVYRTYIASPDISSQDVHVIEMAIADASRRNPTVDPSIFRFIQESLLLKGSDHDPLLRQRQLDFAGKFQQLSAPVTAKGIEDTAFYIYNRFISLNEVGGNPANFGISSSDLHRYLIDRQQNWPHALSPLSTHDTKRSEDVRARLNVVSETPGEWFEAVGRWTALNAKHRVTLDQQPVPDANEEYLIYQTLVGAWRSQTNPRADSAKEFASRINLYLQKAIREAKVHTIWTKPAQAYEDAVAQFITRLLDPTESGLFLTDLARWVHRIELPAIIKSLAQTLLRITAPGVPDTYQGTELIDLSLVDPDNRRPVDYAHRNQLLNELDLQLSEDWPETLQNILTDNKGDRAKLFVTSQALRYRRAQPELFSHGAYLPLDVTGPAADRIFAFARIHGNKNAIIIVPRFTVSRMHDGWTGTSVVIPQSIQPGSFRNIFSSRAINVKRPDRTATINLSEVFAPFPLSLIVNT
jgi:(1->4)-alpha-D-glucan 1-alpha-D-glucosylmutase